MLCRMVLGVGVIFWRESKSGIALAKNLKRDGD